ncbi:serine/threonine-protein kinase [Streptomyces omiyaensis]|uniref:Serine/threonine-protein kinase n=1 Tax=Streptomyces omiyaensis TaxID=68247 RepID=A0ABW7BRT1_9ACTN
MGNGVRPPGPGDPERVGPYRLEGVLGRGGMGAVYLARSPGGKPLAVKVIRHELAQDAESRRRFAREVRLARAVNGVFTAGVVDADPEGDPPWLATVHVPGPSLGTALRATGPWPERSVLALGAGLAEALDAIHRAGVVHRDLKPSNILLAADGPRVIDFGVSASAAGTSALTGSGVVLGTVGYMAPEQLTGAEVTSAADVFALGAVLALTASGRGPFEVPSTGGRDAGPARIMYRVAHEEPYLAGLTPRVEELVRRCLAKDPAARPRVGALLAELAPSAAAAGPAWLPPALAGLLPGPPPAAPSPTLVDPGAATLPAVGGAPPAPRAPGAPGPDPYGPRTAGAPDHGPYGPRTAGSPHHGPYGGPTKSGRPGPRRGVAAAVGVLLLAAGALF